MVVWRECLRNGRFALWAVVLVLCRSLGRMNLCLLTCAALLGSGMSMCSVKRVAMVVSGCL